jgi:Sec-independent protein translocase protein TatA
MFNIGWGELLVIAVIILFAFGPEDIPKIMYNLGRVVRRFRYMRFALSSQFEDFMEKAEAKGRTAGKPIEEVLADDELDADEHLITMLPKAKEENDGSDPTPDRG